MASVQIVFGLVLLALGGEALVRGAVGIGQRMALSPLVVGLVLVGFGTSTPELAATMSAALAGSPGIALGNVIGSNIANILLILGISALIWPIATEPRAFKRDAPMLALTTLAFVAFAFTGQFGRLVGAGFLAVLAAYLLITYLQERRLPDAQARIHAGEAELASPHPHAVWLSALFVLVGIGALIAGATLTVSGSVAVARAFGMSEAVIGLTIVAIGTSLPELSSSVIAALRRHTDIAFGNIIGSNIFNILGILGATALVTPIVVPPDVRPFDLWALAGATALVLFFAFTDHQLSRREGGVLLALYIAYMGALVFRTVYAG